MKRKIYLKFVSKLMLVSIIGMTAVGCGSNSDEAKSINDTKTSLYAEADTNAVSDDTSKAEDKSGSDSDSNTAEYDKSIASGYYLSLGGLNENVTINGSNRDEAELTVADNKIVFPQGAVRSIAIDNWGRKISSCDVSTSDVEAFVENIEKSELIDAIPARVQRKMCKIESNIVYLNSHGEFRTIGVVSYGDGYCEIFSREDSTEDFAEYVKLKNSKGEDVEQIFFKSEDVEKTLRDWIGFKEKKTDNFDKIKSASLFYLDYDEIKLSDEQIEELKGYLKLCNRFGENPCGAEACFEAETSDGEKLYFSVAADGDFVCTDNHVYEIDSDKAATFGDFIQNLIN